MAINDVSFAIKEGESVGVLGRNGAGKSTLLKLLTRVTRPSAGRINVSGSMSSLLEVGAGFHHDLSGLENIFLAGSILGMSRRTTKHRLDEIVAFSELENFLAQPVRTYSSGMFLRLAFSVGIHLESDILVIDEALAVGDKNFQEKCFRRIDEFKAKGGTLVLVSHDENQLRAVCERGILLSHGELKFDGDINTALQHYNLI
ncbi:ABC transporter ATP-binding protein [Dryocola sp. BD626]|uniref:ABC transporter ATP-binding protein n=1 Tax=Dryocola sp. BD626 TaxID=3133273 RepID=UPI003F4F65EA